MKTISGRSQNKLIEERKAGRLNNYLLAVFDTRLSAVALDLFD
jgi:hypothetical protein